MSVTVKVTAADGAVSSLEVPPEETLMEALRDRGLVLGTCGGMCSCGTCHVYIDAGAALPAPGEDEADMLEALVDVVEVRPTSRLSCQVKGADLGDSPAVTIAPQF